MITATCFDLLRPSADFLRKSISALYDLCSYVTMVRSHHLWYLLLLLLLRGVAMGGVCDVGMR